MTHRRHAKRRNAASGRPVTALSVQGARVLTCAALLLGLWVAPPADAQEPAAAVPHYKPSSRSPAPVDITSNAYGFSRSAPDALAIGDRAPDFQLRRAGGGALRLREHLARGDVVLVFYRGHW